MLREISAQKQKRKIGPRVIGMGLVALDVVFGAEDGRLPECFAGGTCGNVLTVLSFLGWQSDPVSRLDQSQAAELLIQDLRKWNVSDQFISRDPTGRRQLSSRKLQNPFMVSHATGFRGGAHSVADTWRDTDRC